MKKNNAKFHCLLVSGPCSYCNAVQKRDPGTIHAAVQKRKDQTCWKLSSVAIDGREEVKYISAPLKICEIRRGRCAQDKMMTTT